MVLGSSVKAFGDSNLHVGKSDWLVVEGCEYRRSFLYLQPFGIVLLNCELEHVDYYKDEADYMDAFASLINKLPKNGFLVFNKEDKNALSLSQRIDTTKLEVDMDLVNRLKLDLKVLGEFNQLNAAHAYLAGVQTKVDKKDLKKGLESFVGTSRRMETKGEKDGTLVMDDYGHHPTEIKATLKALREYFPTKRIICIFQPHQYSRTHHMLDEFEHAFENADWVMIPNIYEARDHQRDKEKVNVSSFVDILSKNHARAQWKEGLENTTKLLFDHCEKNDLLITMGAGDVYKIGDAFLKRQN